MGDLNDPTKFKIESRSSAAGTICTAPDGEEIEWLDIVDETMEWSTPTVLVDGNGDTVVEPLLDENGDPVLDSNDDPMMQAVYERDIDDNIIMNTVIEIIGKKAVVNQTTKDSVLASRAIFDTQADREVKLQLMRDQRDVKLTEMDHMAVDVALGTRADAATIATYKSDLKDITDGYKDGVSGVALSAIDALADDLSDLTWPTAP